MDVIMLFTDGSVNTHSQIGYGAYLTVLKDKISIESLSTQVKLKKFTNTSSTKLELETLLWALNDLKLTGSKVVIYTDSQNILSLPGRRNRLEQNNYRSKNNRFINNSELYQEFYRITDLLDFEIIKVRGHRVSSQKDTIEKLFTLVDKASRQAIRKEKI